MTGNATRAAGLVYGGVAYAAFLAAAAYAAGFLAGGGVPTTVDGPSTTSTITAVGVDLVLLSLFALQHSVMARASFKRWWTNFVPTSVERSTYVLSASLFLLLLFTQWQPVPNVIWDVDSNTGRIAIWALYGLGWLTVAGSTFLIDHCDLFGLRQVYLHARRLPYRAPGFRTPLLHRLVRRPLMSGFFILFWATPTMTVGHLLFAAALSGYILIGIPLEERDLVADSPEYAAYAARTPRFIRRLRAHPEEPSRRT